MPVFQNQYVCIVNNIFFRIISNFKYYYYENNYKIFIDWYDADNLFIKYVSTNKFA